MSWGRFTLAVFIGEAIENLPTVRRDRSPVLPPLIFDIPRFALFTTACDVCPAHRIALQLRFDSCYLTPGNRFTVQMPTRPLVVIGNYEFLRFSVAFRVVIPLLKLCATVFRTRRH